MVYDITAILLTTPGNRYPPTHPTPLWGNVIEFAESSMSVCSLPTLVSVKVWKHLHTCVWTCEFTWLLVSHVPAMFCSFSSSHSTAISLHLSAAISCSLVPFLFTLQQKKPHPSYDVFKFGWTLYINIKSKPSLILSDLLVSCWSVLQFLVS